MERGKEVVGEFVSWEMEFFMYIMIKEVYLNQLILLSLNYVVYFDKFIFLINNQ